MEASGQLEPLLAFLERLPAIRLPAGRRSIGAIVRVVQKSGHRTIRLILNPPADTPVSQAVLEKLRELGCAYEGANKRFIGVDIPPGVDLMEIRQFLIGTGQQWEHADPTYDELFPDSR